MRRCIKLGLWVVFALRSGAAFAQGVQGHSALALGVIVGSYSPLLTHGDKAVLAALMPADGRILRSRKVVINANEVRCRAGDVDITNFNCQLKFGGTTKVLSGRAANELLATLGEAGVHGDGAAGTIYYSLSNLSCVISLYDVAQKNGGGASCAYKAD